MACRTNALLAKGVTPQAFSDETLYFNPGDPQRPYKWYPDSKKNSVHWGQRKLLLAVVQFFVAFWDVIKQIDSPQIVYAGAAPGTNINLLVKMFPNFTWHLYDPRNVWKIDESERVKIYTGEDNGYFTDEVAESWGYTTNAQGEIVPRNDVIFLSDIRMTTDEFDKFRKSGIKINDAILTTIAMGMDDQVKIDMAMQESWHKLMKPVLASFKFRLPYVLVEGKVMAPVPAGQTVVSVNDTAFNLYQRGQVFGVKKLMDTNFGSQYVPLQGPIVVEKDAQTLTLFLDQGFQYPLNVGDDVLVPNQELMTRYLSGYVAKGIWAPHTTTEGRHTPAPIRDEDGNIVTTMLWDNLAYESQQFWQNTIGRQETLFYNIFTGELEPYVGSELCNDFDSTAEAYVLYMYMQQVHEVAVEMDYVNLLSNLMTVYINVGALTDIDQDLNADLTIMQEQYPFDSTNINNPWHLVASSWESTGKGKKKRIWLTLSKLRKDPSLLKKMMKKKKKKGKKEATIYDPVPPAASSVISTLPRVNMDQQKVELSDLVAVFNTTDMKDVTVVAAPPAMYRATPDENVNTMTYSVAIAPPSNYVERILL